MSSIPELAKEMVHHLGDMFRSELRLARTEALESAKTMGGSFTKLGIGVAFAAAAIMLIGFAVVEMLPAEVPRSAAFALAGLAFGIAGLVFMQMGKAAFAPKSITLPKTREQIGRDIETLKEHLPS